MATDYKLRITAQDKSKKGFNSVNKNINSTQSAMKKLAGAFAGVFAVRQLVQFGNQALQVADDIGKLADSVNVSTTFLQQYQFAAEQSGISTEGFTKALRFFAKGVGEATMGTGLAKRAFEEMGISLEDAGGQTKSTEDLFKEFFHTLESIQDPLQRSGLLAQVFGSRVGIQMANLIKSGAMAMDDLAESATGIIDEETIRNAEAFNDTMNRLKRQVLVPLQSAFVNTSKAILDFAEAMGLIKPDLFTKSLDELNTSLDEQNAKLQRNTELVERFGAIPQYTRPLEAAKKQIELLEDAITKREKQIEIEKKLQATQTEGVTAQENINNSIKENITVVKQFADTVEGELTRAFTDFFDSTSKQFLDFKNLSRSVARAVINELMNIFVVQKLVGMATTAITNAATVGSGGLGDAVDGIQSLNGGGYTGNGIRAGGLDGKGGRLAMIHPQETVIDHTKGQAIQSAPTVNFNISTVDAAGFDQLLASRKGLITSIINNAMNNQGKMGVV
jgi:hypothetical protein